MAKPKKKAESDTSRKFVLRGGPYDKMVVRLYPDVTRDGVRKSYTWPSLEFIAATYVHPRDDQQNDKKPFMLFEP